jgi:DNA-directed RNA polymerase subunit alpha
MTLVETEIQQIPRPHIITLVDSEHYGKFAIEPLDRGFASTLGNPLRRVLLSSLRGAAVTWIKIDGVLHEYSVVPHVKEEVLELILNVKAIRWKAHSDRPGTMRLEAEGEGKVKAGDIITSVDFDIANPELHLATMDSPDARLSMEFNVEQDKGYIPAQHDEGLPIGVLPVDALFSPVRKVNYTVERTRLGQVTDYERLVLEVWTDGTISAIDAVTQASQILADHFLLFGNVGKDEEEEEIGLLGTAQNVRTEQHNMPIEQLALSARNFNSLKRANLNKVGDILDLEASELRKIRNFGEKSLQELYGRLSEHGLLPESTEDSEIDDSQTGLEEDGAVVVSRASDVDQELL